MIMKSSLNINIIDLIINKNDKNRKVLKTSYSDIVNTERLDSTGHALLAQPWPQPLLLILTA